MGTKKQEVIFVAGHGGMVGSAIVSELEKCGYKNILTASRKELNLCDQGAVNEFFRSNSIDQVYLSAAKVGGIYANNTYPAEFIYENLMVQSNIIHTAHACDIQKLLFLGSSCIYPRDTDQPMVEEALLTGQLEGTNEPYAIAKIAGIKMCESYNRQYGRDYRSVMPTNLYGPNDNYHPENSHVIPALIRRFHEAAVQGQKEVVVWGSGTPLREFLHVDDMASACVHVMNVEPASYAKVTSERCSHINVGFGKDIAIREIAFLIGKVCGFQGDIKFDTSKPDGTPKKLLNTTKINSMGWFPKYELAEGLANAYEWYLENITLARFA